MDDAQLLRYSRHILLPELGLDAQEKFAARARADRRRRRPRRSGRAVLAAAGVGTLTLCDADRVDLTNLQRQILFATRRRRRAQGRRGDGAHSRRSIPTCAVDAARPRASGRASSRRSSRARRRRARLQRQLRDAARGQSRLRRGAEAARVRAPRSASTARSRCSTRAIRDAPCYHCLFGEGEALEETRCAIDGRVRAARRHRRRHAGRRSTEAHRRVGAIARRPAAAARRARRCTGAKCACRAIPACPWCAAARRQR